MPRLNLTSDQLLTTTRSVRRRLDLTRPVEPELIKECLEIALQAPTGGNSQQWHFVVVTDEEKRRAIGELYRRAFEQYIALSERAARRFATKSAERALVQQRVQTSAQYLAEHIHEVPVHIIPCMAGRMENATSVVQAGAWGSIIPATWSLMLAARERGLGSAWTTLHITYEQEAAQVLGIPYEKITQAALIPLAYTIGDEFKPAPREPLESVLHWNGW